MKKLIAIGAVVALFLVSAAPAMADTTQDVTVTATPTYIGIANSPGVYDFGVVKADEDQDTTTGYFTITNYSTILIDITLVCDGWTGDSNSWTYGAAGENTARLKASGTNGGTGGSTGAGAYDLVILDSVSVLLADDLATSTNVDWEMQLDAPTSFSYPDEQTTTVTITATAS